MPDNTTYQFHSGLVTARDPANLKDGELQAATGCEYRVGSPEVHKLPGRTDTSNTMGGVVRGIHKLQYDTGTDALVAVANGTIYESSVSTSPSFTATGVTNLTETAVPHFSAANDRWIMVNGTDRNKIREPANVPGTSEKWRDNGMLPVRSQLVATASTQVSTAFRPDSDTGESGFVNYVNTDKARDTDVKTFSHATMNTQENSSPRRVIYSWGDVLNPTSGHSLLVSHTGVDTARTRGIEEKFGLASTTRHIIEYSVDGGASYITLSDRIGHYSEVSVVGLPDGLNVDTAVKVRCTMRKNTGYGGGARLFDIRIQKGSGGGAGTFTTTNDLFYLLTERYTDSDNLIHESSAVVVSEKVSLSASTTVAVTLPASVVNSFATDFVIYRSLDTTGGGYPDMFEVGTAPVTDVGKTWFDDFSRNPLTTTADWEKVKLYDTVTALYPDNSTLTASVNDPPPLAKLALPFQGSIVYIPVDVPRRAYYSIPNTVSALGLEQVPFFYYLEFITPQNDTVTSAAVTNGGKSMLVFFESYTMVVHRLPQALDPGIFDNRVKEFVSNQRGAAGKLTTTEFSLPTGETFVAAVDALGLWITNGINILRDWSNDLDWETDMSGVDLTTAELVNNPKKYRLELLYADSSGNRQERHFYYGRMKQDGDGQPAPLITGEHPTKVQSKHYTVISGVWEGFGGDSTTTGTVYREMQGNSDASNGHNTSGHIPYTVTTGDKYISLGRSQIVMFGYPKFSSGAKSLSVVGTFSRDEGTSQSKTKTFSAGSQKKLYWNRFADRHNVSFQDVSATSLPALVGYEVEVRSGGRARDK